MANTRNGTSRPIGSMPKPSNGNAPSSQMTAKMLQTRGTTVSFSDWL